MELLNLKTSHFIQLTPISATTLRAHSPIIVKFCLGPIWSNGINPRWSIENLTVGL